MQKYLDPRWLFLLHTVPVLVFFFLMWGEFGIIKHVLTTENQSYWAWFGGALILITTLNFLYAYYRYMQKEPVSLWYGLISLLLHVGYLYAYFLNAAQIVPFTIPRWMVPENLILYAGTFLMPSMAYSIGVLVMYSRPSEKSRAWVNFLATLAIPLLWYIFAQVVLPLWRIPDSDFVEHLIVVSIISGTLGFLFLLLRGIYILVIKKGIGPGKGIRQLWWKVPVSILLPQLGLAVNQGFLLGSFYFNDEGIFGNFNNPWFYILAAANGILLCLPELGNKVYRLILFAGRWLLMAYTFYFFIIFLPFLPFSVLAIVVFGLGFLMLVPLLLFVVHVSTLAADIAWLKAYFPTRNLRLLALVCALCIPAVIVGKYLNDRRVLHEALDYVYTPDYAKSYDIDRASLSATLGEVKYHKERGRTFVMGAQLPYLSHLFNWLVLDHMTLSENKLRTLHRIFYGEYSFESPTWGISDEEVDISGIQTRSRYDSIQNAWISWVDLEITNYSSGSARQYATQFELPEGCWISDYYLYVGERKEMGILAEKKAAVWVFNQIVNTRRDPGILYYLTGNRVNFQIFPFNAEEVRKTGIEFLHKEPVTFSIDKQVITLGNRNLQKEITPASAHPGDPVLYISAQEKASLPLVKRQPYYHFLVDVSEGEDSLQSDIISRIEKLIDKNLIPAENARISFVNTYIQTQALDATWQNTYRKQPFEGGFYLSRAVKSVLSQANERPQNTYPVLVVLTDSIERAIFETGFADFAAVSPESPRFYSLGAEATLFPHSLGAQPGLVLDESVNLQFDQQVRAFPDAQAPIAYLADDGRASIVLQKPVFVAAETDIREKNWQSALLMHGMWRSQVLHPEASAEGWLSLVKYSFMARVMTPVTSYLVVESEEQKEVLRRKQAQVLSSNKSLDLGEDEPQMMSEPELWQMLLLLALVMGVGAWRRRKKSVRAA